MPITAFPAIRDSTATRTRLNEIVTAVNTLVAATPTVSAQVARLDPEYPGVVWHDLEGAPGGAFGYYQEEEGALDTEYEGVGGRQYYEWSAEGASQVSVSAALKWRLPENFDSWQAAGDVIELAVWTTDSSGEAECDVTVYRNTTEVAEELDQDSAATWGTVGFTSAEISGGTWAAGDVLTMEVTLRAQNASRIRLAEVLLNYSGT